MTVGGTSLFLNADNSYNNEVGWSGSGGGVSQYQPEPSYQDAVQSTGNRTIPDISLDADPSTGVAVFDSYDDGKATPWFETGGTSVAAPATAGLFAIADQGRALAGGTPLTGYNQTLPALYSLKYTDFNDVITGNNGFAATPGYDLVTGLGTPKANLLVPDLAAYDLATEMAVTFEPPSSVVAGADFGIVVSSEDSFGNVDSGFSGTATLSLSSNPGGVSFSPVTVAFANGQAVFDGLTKVAGQRLPVPDHQSQLPLGFDESLQRHPQPDARRWDVSTRSRPMPACAAINAADSNGFASNTIVLGAGIYPLDNTALGQLVIQDTASSVTAKTLSIVGAGSSSTTIEPVTSKGWTDRIFEIVSTAGASEGVMFQGLTITGGYATGGGILGGAVALAGGVLIDGGTVSMTDVAP